MAHVRFDEVSLTYPGAEAPSVTDVSFEVEHGEFFVLTGPAEAGKSSVLRLLAGLEEATSGRIFLDDEDVTQQSPKARDVAMVLQNYALYPNLTVSDNMGFALKIAGVEPDEIRRRVEQAAAIMDLERYLSRRPQELSRSARQRVAMSRAIVRKPKVFLMDEPLANLDTALREKTREQVLHLQRATGLTTVYATNNPADALQMADRVAVMVDGKLQQCDTPERIKTAPATVQVEKFLTIS